MSGFAYHRPHSLTEASELLGRPGSVALAGGTDLLVSLRHRAISPVVVVDLKSVAEIGDQIEIDDGYLRIGARVVLAGLIRDENVRERFPALVAASSAIGSSQIRNRATLAGNLCNASPAADTAPVLLAHRARLTISGGEESRTVPLDEFFIGPGETRLSPGDIVTSVDLPIPATRVGSAFARVTRRRGMDLASVSVACVLDSSGFVRFGFGAVGPTPLVAESTLPALTSDDGWDNLLAVTNPISDIRASASYRRAMLRVHSRRSLEAAVDELEAGS